MLKNHETSILRFFGEKTRICTLSNRSPCLRCKCNCEKRALPAGFEPTRGDPIGFQVQRLNHSAKAAWWSLSKYYLNTKISPLKEIPKNCSNVIKVDGSP